MRAAGQRRKKEKDEQPDGNSIAPSSGQDELQFDAPVAAVDDTERSEPSQSISDTAENKAEPIQKEVEVASKAVVEPSNDVVHEESPSHTETIDDAVSAAQTDDSNDHVEVAKTEAPVAENVTVETVAKPKVSNETEAVKAVVTEKVLVTASEKPKPYVRVAPKLVSHAMAAPAKVEAAESSGPVLAISDDLRGSFDKGGKTAAVASASTQSSSPMKNPVKVD